MISSLTHSLRRSLRMTRLAWFIARHYLFSRERQALEWIVTLISIAGVAVGVGTIISTFGIIDGIMGRVVSQIVAGHPAVSIHQRAWSKENPDPKILAQVRALPEVRLAEPVLMQEAMVMGGRTRNRYLRIYATDEVREENLFNAILPGGAKSLRPEPGKILLNAGVTTASQAGQTVELVAQAGGRNSLLALPKRVSLTVQDSFKVGNNFVGQYIALAGWADVRALAGKPAGVDSVYVMLRDPMTALAVKAKLLKILPQGTTIKTWNEDFEEMFSSMKIIKCGMALVMLMTMVVAALNIIGTLTLIVIQKTREIGILKAMGAPRQLVGRIFLAEGALVGVVGSLIGIAFGYCFCWAVKAWKIPMPGNLFRFREIPAQFSPSIALLTALAAVLICTLAALAPAWRAGGLNPVEALRHD